MRPLENRDETLIEGLSRVVKALPEVLRRLCEDRLESVVPDTSTAEKSWQYRNAYGSNTPRVVESDSESASTKCACLRGVAGCECRSPRKHPGYWRGQMNSLISSNSSGVLGAPSFPDSGTRPIIGGLARTPQ